MSAAGDFKQTGAGLNSIGDAISAGGSGISVTTATTLIGNASCDTSGASGAGVFFGSTINGDGVSPRNLTITTGPLTGIVFLAGAVGGTTRIGKLTIASALNVTAGAITAGSIIQSAGTGMSTFGALNTDNSATITLTGTAFSFTGPIVTTSGGAFNLTNSGLATFAAAADATLDGPFTQSGAGMISTGADIFTTNDNISWLGSGAMAVTDNVEWNAGLCGGGDITVAMTVNDDGGGNSLTLSGNKIVFMSDVGGIAPLGSIFFQSCKAITDLAEITVTGNATINVIEGGIKSLGDPLVINLGGILTVGGCPTCIGAFVAPVVTVFNVLGNELCIIQLNGTIIQDCGFRPTSATITALVIPTHFFFVIGLYEPFIFSLGNYYYFKPDFLTDRTVNPKPESFIYWIPKGRGVAQWPVKTFDRQVL